MGQRVGGAPNETPRAGQQQDTAAQCDSGPGVVKHPSRINWSRTDIRSIPIVMGPGSSNPLGRVKFIFPNHHSVYMHDTPNRGLFASKRRDFSHGCIRVRNPVRLAEIIMSETSGWDSELVMERRTGTPRGRAHRRTRENPGAVDPS